MKYVYIVTTIAHEVKPGIVSIPNLGVHTSFRRALSHYGSVLVNRDPSTPSRYVQNRRVRGRFGERSVLLDRVYFAGLSEEVRLERWMVGGRG